MPLRLPDQLPAIELLKKENIFVMNETRAHTQMVRPFRSEVERYGEYSKAGEFVYDRTAYRYPALCQSLADDT